MSIYQTPFGGWWNSDVGQMFSSEGEAQKASYYASPEGQAAAKAASDKGANLTKLQQQILGQGLTSKWSGEGFGSAEANAADMAKILSGIGITDIRQFGEIPKYRPINATTDESGKPIYGLFNEYGFEPIPDQSKVTLKDGRPFIEVGTTYGNKVTGQAVPNTYSERQTGNAWGGTFAGSGNTGYRVQFDAQGNPYFYTTGASSNDLANLLGDNQILNFAANIAAATFGGPAGVAALQLAQGNDIEDAAKAAAIAYAGGQIASGVNPAISEAIGGGTTGNIAAKAITSGTMAELQGGDFLQGAIKGAATAGIDDAKLAAQQEAFDNAMTESGLAGQTAIDENTFDQEPTVLEPWQQSAFISQLQQELAPFEQSPAQVSQPEVPIDNSGKLAALDAAKALIPIAAGALLSNQVSGSSSDTSTDTGYPIVPVPADWKSPEYNQAFAASAPVDFGTRELLKGTQWENPAVQPMSISSLVNTLNSQYMPLNSLPQVSTGQKIGSIGDNQVSIDDIIASIGRTNPQSFDMNKTIGQLNNAPASLASIISGIQSQYG